MRISRIYFSICFLSLTIGSYAQFSGELILKDPPFKQCHASTIVEISDHKYLIAFFGGSYEGCNDVKIWGVTGSAGNWSEPVEWADGRIDPDSSLPCWNPVLTQMPGGEILLFYKVGKNPKEWFGMSKVSFDEGRSWSEPARLPDGILGPIRNKPLMNREGLLLCPSSVETNSRWWVTMEILDPSTGQWSHREIDPTTPFEVIQPAILETGNRQYRLLCRSKQNKIVTSVSEDSGITWSRLETIPLMNPNSGIDAIGKPGGLYYLVYNPAQAGKEWWEGRNQLNLAESDDAIHWKEIRVLEKHPSGEYSYPAMIYGSDGKLHITYTYDRTNFKYVEIGLD
jgi:alpha-L-fucosidase